MVTELQSEQRELAEYIRAGSTRGPQCFGSYFDEKGGSCALGAVYDAVYHLPRQHGKLIPDHLERLFAGNRRAHHLFDVPGVSYLESIHAFKPELCRHRPPCAQLRTGADDPVRRGFAVQSRGWCLLDAPPSRGMTMGEIGHEASLSVAVGALNFCRSVGL